MFTQVKFYLILILCFSQFVKFKTKLNIPHITDATPWCIILYNYDLLYLST